MQNTIRTTGPINAEFIVYDDFYNYKGGIYEHVTGEYVAGHSVRIVGWGEKNGTDYWIAANSWGDWWGENGWFKIKFGDSNINEFMYSCTPEV